MAPSGTRLAAVVLGVLLVAGPAQAGVVVPGGGATGPGPGAGAAAQPGATATNATLERTVTLARGDERGAVTVTVAYDVPADAGPFTATVAPVRRERATVAAATGFDRVAPGVYAHNGSEPGASIEFSLSLPRSTFRRGAGVDRGSWALVRTPTVATGGESDPAVETAYRVEGAGVATPGFSYLGPHESYNRTGHGETIHLVVPAAASPRHDPDEVLAALAESSRLVTYGGRSGEVYAIAMPVVAADRRTIGRSVENAFWVRADGLLDHPDSPWIHEYLHTRERYTLTAGNGWLGEGIAEYYTAAVVANANRSSFGRTLSHLRGRGDSEATLTDRATWGSSTVPYEKGQRVVAALDARIRAATDGEANATTVVRRMNRRGGSLSHREVRGIVKGVAGPETAAWFDRHATTGAVARVETSPHAYALGGSRDADGDGVSNRLEATVGTDPFDPDTDGDGLDDGAELFEADADPPRGGADGDPDDRRTRSGAIPAGTYTPTGGSPEGRHTPTPGPTDTTTADASARSVGTGGAASLLMATLLALAAVRRRGRRRG